MAQQITVDGVELQIEGEGEPTLLFVHGWPDTWRLWDAQVAHLRGSYRCVRFTLPGFDLSRPARPLSLEHMVQLFRAIAVRVCPQQPLTLVLHDWGCVFGYAFAARHPELVERVVGVDIGDSNSAAFRRSLGRKQQLMIFLYQFWLALAWKFGGALGDWMTRAMARAMRCPADPAAIGAQMNYPYYIQWFGAYGSYRGLPRFVPHCPMLYIYGQRKPVMFHSGQWLERLNGTPGSAARGFRAGHWVMLDQGEAFNQCLVAWLSQPAAGP